MDNYKGHNLDKTTDTFCTKCEKVIEDINIFAPSTEYEQETTLCDKCYDDSFHEKTEIKPI